MKVHLSAIIAAFQAYRCTIRAAKAKKDRMEASQRDPLMVLFEAKFCQLDK